MQKLTMLIFTLILIGSFSLKAQQNSDSLKVEKQDSKIVKEKPLSEPITVYVYFEVNTEGKVQNVEAKKVKCKKCNKETIDHFKKEAIKAVETSPQWIPSDSVKIEKTVSYIVPIKFDFFE